ncbi:MAG: acyltransferase family protein [Streptosporangiales bacterium]|nr:acyltransferase family protein [Streptosporangiales bacterium]
MCRTLLLGVEPRSSRCPRSWTGDRVTTGTGTVSQGCPTSSVGVERPPARDPLLDNAKFLAIALVVVGHAIEPLRDVPAANSAYMAIYAFHMPVFILIAGYLSRGFTGARRQARRLLDGVVIPYLVFEISYELLRDVARGQEVAVSLLDPSFAMWFLVALLIWRLTVPLWKAMPPGLAVGVAVVVSMLVPLTDLSGELDLYRVLGFLPFYVAGLVLPDWYLELVRMRGVRALALPVLFGAVFGAYQLTKHGSLWIYYAKSYEQVGLGAFWGMGNRAAALALGVVLLTAFLAVVPRRSMWFTGLGAATMYVYLLHRYVVKGATSVGLYDAPWLHTVAGTGLVVLLAVAVTLLLSSPPVVRLARPFVEPRLDWLLGPSQSRQPEVTRARV